MAPSSAAPAAYTPASPLTPAWPASAASHGLMPCPRQPARTASASPHGLMSCPRQPARTASASSHGTVPGPSSSQTGALMVTCQPKVEPHAPHVAVPHRTDRRSALTAHLSSCPPPSGSAGTPAATDREAELLQATARLQQRCASLAADLAAAQARQGPLLQRLRSAGRAFAELLTSPPTGASMPFSSLHAVLSSTRGAPPGAPH